MNLQQTAFAIYELMKSFSILKITNCMTRLRLQLKTEDIANLPLKELKNIPNVLGVNLNDNELQIILGPGKVNEVTAEFKKLYANKNLEANTQNTNQNAITIKNNLAMPKNFINKSAKKMLHLLNYY